MRRERETFETPSPHCPMCERPLEGIYHYPRIIIKDLVVSPIPDHVRDYTLQQTNLSKKVGELSKKPEVKDYLKRLSSLKGETVNFSEIKPRLPEYKDEEAPGYFKLDGRFYLHVLSSKTPEFARVSVMSHINSSVGWGFVEVAKIAVIKYKGVLNNPNLPKG